MSVEIVRLKVAPGSRGYTTLKVCKLLNGSFIEVPVHIVNGVKPGPKLLLSSLVHGSEWFITLVLNEFVLELDPAKLSGTVVYLPIVNPTAFGAGTSNTPEDMTNLNRAFPGYTAPSVFDVPTVTQRLAYIVNKEILEKIDHVLDFHCSAWGRVTEAIDIHRPAMKDASQELKDEIWNLAKTFGSVRTIHDYNGAMLKTLSGYAATIGKPSIGIELGGGGWGEEIEKMFFEKGFRGIRNIMVYLGMLEGEIAPPDRKQILITERYVLSAIYSGWHMLEVGIDQLGEIVDEGQLLGKIIDPYTVKEVEEIQSPCKGPLYILSGRKAVQAGDLLFCVGDMKYAKWLD